jgi:hypothetical protein
MSAISAPNAIFACCIPVADDSRGNEELAPLIWWSGMLAEEALARRERARGYAGRRTGGDRAEARAMHCLGVCRVGQTRYRTDRCDTNRPVEHLVHGRHKRSTLM